MTPMKVSLMFHFLIWTFAWNILQFFRVLRYFLCLIVLNIAAVTITVYKCIYLMAFTMCDGSDYVTACFFYLFIELLTVKENVLYMYMSFNAI